MSFGYLEMGIVALVFLLLFGGAKLPSLMRNMGRSINEFKVGMEEKPVPRKIDDEEREQAVEASQPEAIEK